MAAAKNALLIFYWLVLLVGCYLIYHENFFYAAFAKAALMPALFAYLFVSLKRTHSYILKIYFLSAIGTAWVGDVFGIVGGDSFLMIGILNHAISNLGYTLAFRKIRPIKLANSIRASFGFIGFAVSIFCTFFFVAPIKDLGHFFPFYLLYTIFICSTGVYACNILESTSRKRLSTHYFLPGSILTLASLGAYFFNKYHFHEPSMDVISYLTYGYAQVLFINGFRKTARE